VSRRLNLDAPRPRPAPSGAPVPAPAATTLSGCRGVAGRERHSATRRGSRRVNEYSRFALPWQARYPYGLLFVNRILLILFFIFFFYYLFLFL
jgi:hypothetical protein